jgi:tetratricopeptide (TPR) repeat protein
MNLFSPLPPTLHTAVRLALRGFATCLAVTSLNALAQPAIPPAVAPASSASSASAAASAPVPSRMDGDLFYQLLLGELNARNGQPNTGYALILDAARKTNDPKLYARAVDMAIEARSGEDALQAARAWKQAQPSSRLANRQLLQVLVALNRIPESAEPLRSELASTPAAERAAVLSLIPRNYSRVSDKTLAATTVEKALTEYLSNSATAAPAWTAVGRLRLAADNNVGALEAAQKAQTASPGAQGPALLALEIMNPKQPQAESVIKRYLESDKPSLDIRMGYARALLDAQRNTEAATQVQVVTREKPDYADAWLVQGSLQVQDNQLALADTSLKRYVELAQQQAAGEDRQRGLTQAYLLLSQVAEKRKDFPLAESWIAKIDNSQALVSAQSRRASLLAKQGKMAEARQLIRALPERSPEDKRMKLLTEVQLLRDNQQYQAAYDVLASAAAISPKDTELLYDQAMMAEKLDRFPEMEKLLRQLIAAKPDHAQAYNALGYSMAERNVRLPEAKALIQKALEFAVGDPFITDSLGWVEFRMGNQAEATKILEGAYKAKPDPEIAAHLGEVYWVAGQRDKAMAVWKEGLLLNGENETLLQTLKRLRVKL